MTVTTTYSFFQAGGGLTIGINGSADSASTSNGGYVFAGTNGTTTSGYSGAGVFSGLAGVDPAIAQLTNNNVVVAGETPAGIVYTILAPDGTTVLNTVTIADTNSFNADVAALTGGGFVIVNEDNFTAPDADIDVRVFDNAGALLVNFTVDGSLDEDRNPQVAALDNGNFAVAWTRTIAGETEIWSAVYTAEGVVVAAPQVQDSIGSINQNVSICATAAGFALVYEDNGWAPGTDVDITLARFNSNGTLIGYSDVSMNGAADESPHVARLPNGLLIVSYGDNSTPGDQTDTVVSLIDPITGLVLTSQTGAGGQNLNHDVLPNTITAIGDGIIAIGADLNLDQVTTDLFYVQRLSVGDAANDTVVGDGSLDTMYGNDGNDSLSGAGGVDNLYGGAGDDILDGGAGTDGLIGGTGDDVYLVDDIGDVVFELAGEGDADAEFSSISLTLAANVEILLLMGVDDLAGTGNGLNNTLIGNSGANVLDGGLGADILQGGLGNDTYYVDSPGDVVVEGAGAGTDSVFSSISYTLAAGQEVEALSLTGSANLNATGNEVNNTLVGNTGNNLILGGGGGDIILGGDGDDILDGEAGADGMYGGIGDDTFYVDDAGDFVGENFGSGVDRVFSSIAWSLFGTAVENLTLTGAGNVAGTGSDIANVLIGNSGNNTLMGLDGDDLLRGGAGVDILNGGLGVDTVDYGTAGSGVTANLSLGGASNDGDGASDTLTAIENLTGSSFNDTLTGAGNNNLLIGGLGADALSGLNGDDILRGGGGVDVLDGGGGFDIVDYSFAAAAVTARLDNMRATNDGDGATDTFVAVESLIGSAFNDTLIGGTLGDTLKGGLGSDTLLGFGGNDVLWGGTGALNTLQGGLGDDLYVIEANDSVVEVAGQGTDTVEARINTVILAANVENLLFTGVGVFTGTGNVLNNVITGGSGDDVLRGRGGVDALKGGLGMDTADYSQAAAGVHARLDTMSAINDGEGATDAFTSIEAIVGSAFNDTLVGGGLGDRLSGGLGADTILGFAGDDVLSGGQGLANQLQGGMGDDLYILDAYDTVVELAGQGYDIIEAHVGAHVMAANVEDMYYAGLNKFYGTGNAGNNIITGGIGNDILKGMGGHDTLIGGQGLDEVQFRGTKEQYTVTVQGAGYSIVDNVAGRDGATLVESIETLRFLTGNTTTTLVYPPLEPTAPEPDHKHADDALVLPSLVDDAFVFGKAGDQPQVLPGLGDDHAARILDDPLTLPGPDHAFGLSSIDLHHDAAGIGVGVMSLWLEDKGHGAWEQV